MKYVDSDFIFARMDLQSMPGTSKLFRDYLREEPDAVHLFQHNPFSEEYYLELAEEIRQQNYQREQLSKVLAEQNEKWGAEKAALDNCQRLKEKTCVAVVTGQQTGFLGGPLYAFVKALHAIKLASYLESMLGRSVVPIFWMELEDHDLNEVNHVFIRTKNHEQKKIALNLERNGSSRPINRIVVGSTVKDALEEIKSLWPTTEFTPDLIALLEECYAENESLSEGFGRLISHLLSRFGLIVADPSHQFFKERVSHIFSREIEAPLAKTELFKTHAELIHSKHYHNQVQWQENRLSLFLLDADEKLKITHMGNHYSLNDPSEIISSEDLMNVAASEPERLIPSVLLRPIIQDTIFPTFSYVAGPSEVAYFAQMKPVYRHFETPMPIIFPRAGLTVIGGNARRSIANYNIESHEIFQQASELTKHILSEHVPVAADKCFHWTRNEITAAVDRLKKELDSEEGGFSKAVDTAKEKIDYHMQKLQDRYLRDLEQKHEVVVRRINQLSVALFPGGKLQERVYSIADFYNQFGPEVIDAMYQAIEPQEPNHLIIRI